MQTRLIISVQATALIGLVLIALLAPLTVLAFTDDGSTGPVLVIAAPWSDFDAMIAAAGGSPIGPDRAPMAQFAVSDAVPGEFHDRLYQAGAWAIINSSQLVQFCGLPT